jgi:tight adherence protein B
MSRALLGAALGLALGCGLLLVTVAVTTPRRRALRNSGRLTRLLDEAGMPRATVAGLVATSAASALVVGVIAVAILALPVMGLIGAALGSALPLLVVRRRAARRRRDLQRAWPDAVDVLVSGVRAGVALPEATAALSVSGPEPMRPAFGAFAVEYRATGSFATALDVLQAELADPVADRVVASLRLARDVGGSELGILLRTLSAMLRDESQTRSEIEGRQSWTVAAARMAVAAPWLTLALLCTRPEAVHAFASTAGACVLGIAAVLSVVAYGAMRRIGRLASDERVTA